MKQFHSLSPRNKLLVLYIHPIKQGLKHGTGNPGLMNPISSLHTSNKTRIETRVAYERALGSTPGSLHTSNKTRIETEGFTERL